MNLKLEKILILIVFVLVATYPIVGWVLSQTDDVSLLSIGFPGCLFRSALGVPCPLCGGFTATTRLFKGDLAGAFEANSFALVFIISSGILSILLFVALVWPKSVLPSLKKRTVCISAIIWGALILFVLCFSWISHLI